MWYKWPAVPRAFLQVGEKCFKSVRSYTACTYVVCNRCVTVSVTVEGKIYACGEATNGRLGLGLSSGTIPIPRQITALSNYVVKKVAVHSGGRHAMALTVDGKVFSWGEGDDGKLGHFSRMYVILSFHIFSQFGYSDINISHYSQSP